MPDNAIVIAGAGPNGLMLACELALAGVRPLVVERLAEPATEPKANGLVGQVVRLLDRRGLYAPLAGTPGPPTRSPGYMFAGLPLDLHDLDDHPLHVLPVPQRRVEQVLRDRAAELGVEIRWGQAVTSLDQTEGSVAVGITGSDGVDRVDAAFLVGADGGQSTVRKLAGIDFPGVTRDGSISRTAHATVPREWVDPGSGDLVVPGYGRVPVLRHHRTENGMVVFMALPGQPTGFTTVEWGGAEPSTPMSLDEMRESLRRVLGVEVPIGPPAGEGPFFLRRLTGQNSRVAQRYRAGRVFLVGDAAHVHSGIGGPGLNLGLQDAVNLGWKLAAQVRGTAPAGLLDSYEAERLPMSRRVIMSTQAQTALIGPGPEVTALRELAAELLADPAARTRIVELLAGADHPVETGCAHPLAGLLAPELTVAGRGLADLSRTARPLLLDATGTLGDAVRGWSDRVEVVSGRIEPACATAVLVRPDSVVAWASSDDAPDGAALVETMTRWFGAPLAAAVPS